MFRFQKRSILKKNVLTIILTIVNEGLSLTIVNETTNFIKTVVFGKKISCNFFECRLALSLTVVGELKLIDIFLKTTQ